MACFETNDDKITKNSQRLDWELMRSSPRDGFSTP